MAVRQRMADGWSRGNTWHESVSAGHNEESPSPRLIEIGIGLGSEARLCETRAECAIIRSFCRM